MAALVSLTPAKRHAPGRDLRQLRFAIACRVLRLRHSGGRLRPFNSFLILTGIEMLPLRMAKHCENTSPWPSPRRRTQNRVGHYPASKNKKYQCTARQDLPQGRRAVFTFGLKGGYEAGVKLGSNVKLFSHWRASATRAA